MRSEEKDRSGDEQWEGEAFSSGHAKETSVGSYAKLEQPCKAPVNSLEGPSVTLSKVSLS